MRQVARPLLVVWTVGLLLVPAAQALACPFCAQGAGRYGPGFSLLIGMMLLLPFAAVGLVLRQVLRTEEPVPATAGATLAPGLPTRGVTRGLTQVFTQPSAQLFEGDLK